MLKSVLLISVLFLGACGDDGYGKPDINGESCAIAEACIGGSCLIDLLDGQIEMPGGYCSTDCSTGTGVLCAPDEEMCIPLEQGGTEAYCIVLCEFDADCRVEEDYGCIKLSPWLLERFCLPESLRRPWDDPTSNKLPTDPYLSPSLYWEDYGYVCNE